LRRIIFGLILASLFLPVTALLVPTYLTIVKVPLIHISLLNSGWALWLPGACDAVTIYLLKRFFDQIPSELLDAASIDGAGRLRVLWNVVLPLSRPVLATVSILAMVAMWNDFTWPLLVLQDPEKQTLNVALQRLTATGFVTLNQQMAGLVIAGAPMVAIFLFFQRHILGGLTAGAVKG
jgi:multiple sugar transport system permease protein